MTTYTADQFAGYLKAAGFPANRLAEWTAIGWTESGWQDDVVSSAGAIGGLQIMPFNAPIGGGTVTDLYNIAYNLKVGYIMSGGGQNCAAWDSCYRDIYLSGRYTYLAWPEDGSAAFAELGRMGQIVPLARGPNTTPPAFPGITDTAPAAIAAIQALVANQVPVTHAQLITASKALTSMFGPGWRP